MCVFGLALSSNFFFFWGRQLCSNLFGLCWTVFNQLQRFPTLHYTKWSASQSASQNRMDQHSKRKKKQISSCSAQRVSKQSVGHFGHLEQRTSRVKRPQYTYGLSDSWTGILEVDGYASGVHAHFQVRLCPFQTVTRWANNMGLLARDLSHRIQCVLIQERTRCPEQWLDLAHFNTKMCNWMYPR